MAKAPSPSNGTVDIVHFNRRYMAEGSVGERGACSLGDHEEPAKWSGRWDDRVLGNLPQRLEGFMKHGDQSASPTLANTPMAALRFA
jgi:hypothetical protein